MTAYRSDLPPRPPRIARLPLTEKGYPALWFSAVIDGKHDLRVADPVKKSMGLRGPLCWLCGEPVGRYGAFCIGPMCGINRITAEPASHRECCEYAVRACPFMTRPMAVRNERGLDEAAWPRHIGTVEPGGDMIKRNPGVTLLWVTREWRPWRVNNGVLVKLGEPTSLSFWREARLATRAEVLASIESGFPLLREPAERQGPDAVKALQRMWNEFFAIINAVLPPEAVPERAGT
jgi:hypothetical protein